MTHPEDRLADYVDGTLDLPDRAAVDAHLATCGRCRGEVTAATAARSALVALPEVAPPVGIASVALEAAGATRVSRAKRPVAEPPRWYRFAGVAAAAAAALLLVTLVLPHIGTGGGAQPVSERAADNTSGGGPKLASALEIQDIDYDQASLTTLVASFSSAAQTSTTPSAPGPMVGAASSATGTPQQTHRALACVAKAVPAEQGTLTRLIQARFEGKPAYIAVFLDGPGAGQPADSAAVWVISTKGCSILSSGYTKL
jgi:hypothetical protein